MQKGIKGDYILEVSWGCPSDKYPLHGLFQYDQTKALKNAGKDVVFLALDMRSIRRWRKWGINRFIRDDIPVYEYNFPYGPFSPERKYRIQDKCFIRSMNTICKEHGLPSCVHFHGVMEAISGKQWCLEHDVPYVITEHITPVTEGEAVHRRMTDAYADAASVICVSSRLATDIEKAYGAHTDAVIPNIVDLSVFEQKTDADDALSVKEYRFISAARLHPGKGFDTLLKAYSELLSEINGFDNEYAGAEVPSGKNIHLTIMGDGEDMSALKNECVSLGVSDNVSFTGGYVRKEFAEELLRSDCFVLASKSETFGIVYAEAMAAGVPVISTRCGGPEDFIDDSNGILVPVGDVYALKDAMKNMLLYPALYNSEIISAACKARFSPENVADQIINVINGCIR